MGCIDETLGDLLVQFSEESRLKDYERLAGDKILKYCKPGWEDSVSSCKEDSNTFIISSYFILGSILGSKTINIEDLTFKYLLIGILDNLSKKIDKENTAYSERLISSISIFKDNYIDIIDDQKDIDFDFITKTMDSLSVIMKENDLYWDFMILYIGLFNSILLEKIKEIKFNNSMFQSITEGVYITTKNVIIEDVLSKDKSNLQIRCNSEWRNKISVLNLSSGKNLDYDTDRWWKFMVINIPLIFSSAILMSFMKSETEYQPINQYLKDLIK